MKGSVCIVEPTSSCFTLHVVTTVTSTHTSSSVRKLYLFDHCISTTMPWQKRFTLPPHTKGMHLVTDAVLRECQEGLKGVDIGIFTLNCLHTSAGLTVCLDSRTHLKAADFAR
jgi:hypothetical protein